jgi:hypothetical protein
LKYIVLIIMYGPVLCILGDLSFYYRAWIVIGHPPSYNNPDPGTLHFKVHEQILDYISVFFVLALFFWIIAGLYFLFFRKKILRSIHDEHYIISLLLFIFYLMIFFGPIGVWMAD